jgi:hypothetical protein
MALLKRMENYCNTKRQGRQQMGFVSPLSRKAKDTHAKNTRKKIDQFSPFALLILTRTD